MRNRTIIIVVLLVLCATALATAQTASDLYRQGLAREKVGDCEGAIPLYERIVHEFPSNKDREQVATAKLHLGECWIKRIETDQVKGLEYLNDVTTNYKDLTDIAREATRIKGLMPPAADPGKPLEIVTPFTEDVFSFAISPDGRNLVLQATTNDGKKQLLMQPVDPGKKPVAIAGTEGAGSNAFPFFSPDGKSIGFFADGKLKRVSAIGGIPQELASITGFRGGTWNKDDVIVFGAGGIGGILYRIRANGTEPMAVTYSRGTGQVFPKFLSDGFRFLFIVAVGSTPPAIYLSLGAIDHSARSVIQPVDADAAAFAPPDRMVYVVGGALMAQRLDEGNKNLIGDSIRLADRVALNRNWPGVAALSVSDAGPVAYRTEAFAKRQFRLVDRKGDLIKNLGLVEASGPSSARISRDGKTMTFHRWSGSHSVGSMWMMDTVDGRTSELTNWANSAVWSPDTEHMMLAEQDSKSQQMDLFDRVGQSQEPKHVRSGGGALLKVDDWSTKNYILYERSRYVTLPPDLTALSLSGGVPVVIADNPAADERNGRFSPEGDWVAYQSNELESRDEVFVQRFPGSMTSRMQVSFKGGTLPHWSSDGLQLYFKSTDNHLMSVPITRSADGQDIRLGTAVSLFVLKPGSEFEVAADNKFLINAPTEDAPPIQVLSNWVNKLPAVTPNSTSSPLVITTPVERPTGYDAQTQIVVYDRQQHVLHTIKETGLQPALAISRDGTRVAYLRDGDIWVHDIETDRINRVASNVIKGFKPVWSPDGDRIAYRASRNGVEGVYVTASDGTGTAKMIYEPTSNLFNWSMDGRFLVIPVGSNLAVVPVDGDHKPVSIMPTAGKGSLVLGPESRLLAYLSNESGTYEIYVGSFDPASATDLATGTARKVSTQGSLGMARWNADGKELYYLSSDGGLMVVSDAGAMTFDRQSSTLLFPVPDNFPLTGYPGTYADISGDGQRFVFALPATASTGK